MCNLARSGSALTFHEDPTNPLGDSMQDWIGWRERRLGGSLEPLKSQDRGSCGLFLPGEDALEPQD